MKKTMFIFLLLSVVLMDSGVKAADDDSWKKISYDSSVVKTWKDGQVINQNPYTVVDFRGGDGKDVIYVLVYQKWVRISNTLDVTWLNQEIESSTGRLTQPPYIGVSHIGDYFLQKDYNSISYAKPISLPPLSDRPLTDLQAKRSGKSKVIDWLYDARNHWASDYVLNLFSQKVISGYPDGSFKPDDTVTYEHFIKMLVAVKGITLNNSVQGYESFSNWAKPYVDAAIANRIIAIEEIQWITGSTPIPREMAIKMLMNSYGKEVQISTIQFKDMDSIQYRDEVLEAASLKIIAGYPDLTFRPKGTLTRAEASKILIRFQEEMSR